MTEDQRTTSHSTRATSPSAVAAAAQVLARLTDLARTSLQTQASLAKQSVDLTWSTLVGDLDRASVNKAYVQSVTRESARYWRTVGELGFEYAADLLTLSRSVSTTVLREVSTAGRKAGTRHTSGANGVSATTAPEQGAPETGGGARQVAVTLRGSVGQRAVGTITVANQHPRPRRIQLSAGDVVDSAGTAIGAVLEVSPASVTVPRGQERSVSLAVDLDAAQFSAGQRYSCTVEVSGGDEASINVSLEVTT